jgi:phosphatidylglycerophosphatase A
LKKNILIDALASFFYTGFIPYAPGTWASLIATLIWIVIPVESVTIRIIIVCSTFVVGIIVAGLSELKSGIVDPSYVVIDEVAGMWLALLLLPKIQRPNHIPMILLAFLVFRFFDITKIYPIKNLERLGGGFGIMIDDIAAGIFTAIAVNLIIWIL